MNPFTPDSLPIDKSNWDMDRLLMVVSNASAAMSAYCATLTHPEISPDIFLSPLETKEAVFSSRIEGTVTTLDEIFRYDAERIEQDNKNQDLLEVLNYRRAMRLSRRWIDGGMPINISLIREIQKELMSGVRGERKSPGELRKEQVWIGPKNCKMEDAVFVPPNPLDVPYCLQKLFDYLHMDEEALMQTAILHAQFEIIHPFMDGNGRTGRILIPLYLWTRKKLPFPMLYISEYLEKERDEYTHRLLMISKKGDWENWVHFFLTAIERQAEKNMRKATQILNLYKEMKALVFRVSKSPNNIRGLDMIFKAPIFSGKQFETFMQVNRQTSNRILTAYKKEKILETARIPSGRSSEVFIFPRLYDLINE